MEDRRGKLRRDSAEGRRDSQLREEAAGGDERGFEEASAGGAEAIRGARNDDDRGEERVWTRRNERIEDFAAAQRAGGRATAGDCVHISWRARGARGVSRKSGRSGALHSVDRAKHAAGNWREPAGGILRRVLRSRRVYRPTIKTGAASGAAMGAVAAAARRAAFADGRGAAGDPAASGELRSSGEGEQERHPGAGKIVNRGDAAAGRRFRSGAGAIVAGAGAVCGGGDGGVRRRKKGQSKYYKRPIRRIGLVKIGPQKSRSLFEEYFYGFVAIICVAVMILGKAGGLSGYDAIVTGLWVGGFLWFAWQVRRYRREQASTASTLKPRRPVQASAQIMKKLLPPGQKPIM